MCGITGVFDTRGLNRINPYIIENMSKKLYHRGPDEDSIYFKDNIGLGFQRLSIIDLAHGMQPLFNEDKTVVCICNGEIYNYKELRAELILKNHRFHTESDVEVLPHLYEEYGSGFINKLNGQFAFVIFDIKQNFLLAARDHFGIAPFFYSIVDGLFIFGSEVKAILSHPAVVPKVNISGLDQTFSFPGLISPTTMFENISSLPSGHFLELSLRQEKPKIVEYWDLRYPKVGELTYHQDENHYLEQLRYLLNKAVNYRLNADVPVGFYLSGGLDSSLVVSIAKKLDPGKKQKTFSVAFPDTNLISEAPYQRMMVDYCQTDHSEYEFKKKDISERIKQVIYHCECPLKESYNTAAIALSENLRQNNIKVVLAGQGADELFAGYPGYKFDSMILEGKLTGEVHELDSKINLKLWGDEKFFYENRPYTFGLEKFKLYSDSMNASESLDCLSQFVINKEKVLGIDPIHRRSYIDMKLRLSDHLLGDHGDRMVLANSVEGRYPFLNQELVEFIRTIPPSLKLKDLNEKYILKQLGNGILPSKIIKREKFGFTAPGSAYLIKQNDEYINDMLSIDSIKRQGYFNAQEIKRLKERYSQPNFRINVPFESDMLMTVLTFNIFLDIFKLPNFI